MEHELSGGGAAKSVAQKAPRIIKTNAEWIEIFRDYESSGLSVQEFSWQHSVKHQVKAGTLVKRLYKFAAIGRKTASGFKTNKRNNSDFVQILMPQTETETDPEYRISFSNGRVLSVKPGFHSLTVKQLVELLEKS